MKITLDIDKENRVIELLELLKATNGAEEKCNLLKELDKSFCDLNRCNPSLLSSVIVSLGQLVLNKDKKVRNGALKVIYSIAEAWYGYLIIEN